MTDLIFEPTREQAEHPGELATACVESGCHTMLLSAEAAPAAFYDLSTRYAGELLHKLGLYGITGAAVDPHFATRSVAFQDFVRETNRGRNFRIFGSREEAEAWLRAVP